MVGLVVGHLAYVDFALVYIPSISPPNYILRISQPNKGDYGNKTVTRSINGTTTQQSIQITTIWEVDAFKIWFDADFLHIH